MSFFDDTSAEDFHAIQRIPTTSDLKHVILSEGSLNGKMEILHGTHRPRQVSVAAMLFPSG